MSDVNFIKQYRQVQLKMSEDKKISPHQISLYWALFTLWNECGFAHELSINRNDVMRLSKIGNANTYTNCLKVLDQQKYIKYHPSYNPLIGSKVTIIRYDKGSGEGTAKGGGTSGGIGSGEGTDTLYKLLNNKTIKLINKNASLVNSNLEKWINSESKPKKKTIFNFRKSLIDLGVEEQVAEDWMKVRKTKKATNTETSFNRIKSQIEKSGRDPNECITLAVAKDWKGFEATWIINETKKQNEQLTKSEQRMQQLRDL